MEEFQWSKVCACHFVPFPSDKQINGFSPDKQEERGRREVEAKPVELALTEEHMSCVTGVYWTKRLSHAHCVHDRVSPLEWMLWYAYLTYWTLDNCSVFWIVCYL